MCIIQRCAMQWDLKYMVTSGAGGSVFLPITLLILNMRAAAIIRYAVVQL